MRATSRPTVAVALLALLGLMAVGGCRARPPVVGHEDFRGWDGIVVRNRSAKVVIVPALGRVMRFDLAQPGETGQGAFWRHPGLTVALGPDSNGWINYGGDKAWPAPQAEWAAHTGKGWPPPRTFDAVPYSYTVKGSMVEMVSPVDPAYGVRVRRTIALAAAAPEMTIETSFEKVQGPPVRVGVWTITQLESPERMFVRLPERSAFPGGHRPRLPTPLHELKVAGRMLSVARHPTEKTMLISDGDALLWVGEGPDLLIENETARTTAPGAWPEGAHAQIYTSPLDQEKYVELELFERVRELSLGETATMKVRYTLATGCNTDPFDEASRLGF